MVRLKLLLEHDADPYLLGPRGTPLHLAAFRANEAAARLLPNNGVDINYCPHSSGTPLFSAVGSGDVSIVRLMIERGADASFKHKYTGSTPLHQAVNSGKIGVIKYFLEVGCDTTVTNRAGFTPIYHSYYGKAVRLLMQYGGGPTAAEYSPDPIQLPK